LDAPLQLDQAASIQRRVTTCGGRRKTQPTVRDGLTTTISRMLDTQRSHAVEFKKAVDLALSAPEGVSDCTFRVLTLIDRATP
ncbi:hypothetical protein, partial [Pseudomonas aeruginosa]